MSEWDARREDATAVVLQAYSDGTLEARSARSGEWLQVRNADAIGTEVRQ